MADKPCDYCHGLEPGPFGIVCSHCGFRTIRYAAINAAYEVASAGDYLAQMLKDFTRSGGRLYRDPHANEVNAAVARWDAALNNLSAEVKSSRDDV